MSLARQGTVNGFADTVAMLPRRLVDEIADELSLARRALTYDAVRVNALEALLETVGRLAGCLRREVTIADLVEAPGSQVERSLRLELLRTLRAPPPR